MSMSSRVRSAYDVHFGARMPTPLRWRILYRDADCTIVFAEEYLAHSPASNSASAQYGALVDRRSSKTRDVVRITAIAQTPSRRRAFATRVPAPMALHATTIRFADRGYAAIARAANIQGISVSQYVREAALIRAVLDDLDTAEEALHTAHDLVNLAREVRRMAEVDAPGPPRAAGSGGSATKRGTDGN